MHAAFLSKKLLPKMPGRWGMWMENRGWSMGGPKMQGWLWVQGCWQWGKVLTWHVERVGPDLRWVCTLWKWDEHGVGHNGWVLSDEGTLPCVADEEIEPWMVHDENPEPEYWDNPGQMPGVGSFVSPDSPPKAGPQSQTEPPSFYGPAYTRSTHGQAHSEPYPSRGGMTALMSDV